MHWFVPGAQSFGASAGAGPGCTFAWDGGVQEGASGFAPAGAGASMRAVKNARKIETQEK